MPKYFPDERPLPYEKVLWRLDQISVARVEAIFQSGDSASFCLRLPGLPESSLGYVVNIRKSGKAFEVKDITDKTLTSLSDAAEIVAFLKHASGLEMNDSFREQLLRTRDASG